MLYNFDFPLASLIFLAVLLASLMYSGHLNDKKSRRFINIIIAAAIDIIFDIAACITIQYYRSVPEYINIIFNTVFLFFQCYVPYSIFRYIYLFSDSDNIYSRAIGKVSAVPFAFLSMLLFINIGTGIIFYMDQTGYNHGPMHIFLYIPGALYSLMIIFYIIFFMDDQETSIRWLLFISILVTIIGLCCQPLVPNYSIGMFGVTISLAIMYLTIENPVIYSDTLTSAFNRKALIHNVNIMKSEQTKYQIYMVALDNFTMINEIFGLDGGDKILKDLALLFVREYGRNSVYRYGGDTFAIVLSDEYDYRKTLDKLLRIVDCRFSVKGMDAQITAAVCHIPSDFDTESDDELLKIIEYIIAEAKKLGKGQVYQLSDKTINDMKRRQAVEQSLLACIEDDSFEVHYQPIYDARLKTFRSMEALARLHVDGYGYIPPDEFIEIAEQDGLIVQIGMLVLREVCRFIKEDRLWEKGISFIEVNVSVIQCMRETLNLEIMDVLREFDLSPSFINLEITESVAAYSEENLVRNMAILRLSGLSFSLDDYGSGYSNINYIADLPFSIIKIDKSFIWSAASKYRMEKVLKNTLETFKGINFKVLAEGVEDEETAERLMDMGIDFIQGYYYSRPIPKDKALQFLEAHNKKRGGERFT